MQTISTKQRGRRIALLALYVSLLFASSLVPMDQKMAGLGLVLEIRPGVQNLLHIPAYMLLAILWFQVLHRYSISLRRQIILSLLLSSLIGVLNEFIQLAVPGRYSSLTDVVLNSVGIILGTVLYCKLQGAGDSFARRLVCG